MGKFFEEDVEAFLGRLISACGISGNTQEVSALLEERLRLPQIRLVADPARLGFFQAVINPEHAFRVMMATHMDAVGMRVSFIDDQGFCYLRAVGGIDLLGLKGRRVKIHTHEGTISGLIQGYPLHHAEEEMRGKAASIEAFYVRTAYTGKGKSSIRIGDPVIFDEPMAKLGEHMLMGPGMDNRLGVLIMSELMRLLAKNNPPFCLYGVASSGEEIGCRGIRALTQQIAPHLGIVLDVTSATDYPGANHKKFGIQRIAHGPVIARGYNTRTNYNDLLIQVAEECKIAYQLRAEDLTPTDGREVDEAGVPTVVIRVPATMLHTANDAVDRRDIESTATLVLEFLRRLPGK